jgi:murein L,D-transpeptidase YcbB/YkuD
MEQWRWMPADLGDLYVWVNIPEFTLRVVKNGEVIHTERIIAGKTDTQTPVFSDEMQTIVLHPFWGVPESIKVKELWPSLARGGGVLQRHGLRLQRNGRDIDPASVDWTRADIRNYHVYQPPGGGNVLGVVKFVFPNKHQVYMHDTPTKNLFGAAQRTFSHGCMRVRNPTRLAEVLLAEDKGWAPARVGELVRSGPQNNEIALSRKVPVHVTYFTAAVDEAGKPQLFADVYGHEQRVALALEERWSQIAKGRDHLAPVKAEPIARLAEDSSGFGSFGGSPINDLFKAVFGGF